MKNIFKYAYVALVGAVVAMSVACTNEYEYTLAEAIPSEQQLVYFSANQSTKYVLDTLENTFTVPIFRVDTLKAASVHVSVEASEESTITCANDTIVFSAGQDASSITLSYNPLQMARDTFYTVSIKVDDENCSTDYVKNSITLSVGGLPLPEGDVPTWISLGKCIYSDAFFEFADSVEIFQNTKTPELYRLVNPYPAFVVEVFESKVNDQVSEWIYFQCLKKGDKVFDETVNKDGLVFFYGDYDHYSVNTGWTHPTYDDDVCLVFPGVFSSMSSPGMWSFNQVKGYFDDGTPGCIQLAPYYYMFNTGGWNYTQQNGIVTIVFPGYQLGDFASDITAAGRFIDTEENGQAVFNVTLGPDVAYAKVAFAKGKNESNAFALIDAEDESVQILNASGIVRFPYEDGGDYVVALRVYDEMDGDQGDYSTLINIPVYGEPAEPTETFQAVYIGTYHHGFENLSNGGLPFGEAFDDEAVLYASTSDSNRFMISPWINKGWAENDTEGEGMIFTWDDDDNIFVPGSYCGVSTQYGEMWAWDLVTAGVADMPCFVDYGESAFVFNLAWSVEAGDFGYTTDVFEITGTAAARASKVAAKLRGKSVKTPRMAKIDTDVNGKKIVAKRSKVRKYQISGSPAAKFVR